MTQSWFGVCQKGVFGSCFPLQKAWWVLGCSVGPVAPSLCTLPGRKSTSCTGKMDLAWGGSGVSKEQTLTHLDRKDLCLGRAYASGRLLSPHLRDEDKANSYLTCHPNFNKVLVSLLYQLALFPSHSWDLTRSSQLVCITLGCPSSRESPLRWELLGQRIGLEDMIAVLQR